MSNINTSVDAIQDILTYFICAGNRDQALGDLSVWKTRNGPIGVDAGARLQFSPLSPTTAYISELNGDRLIAVDAGLLLHTPQDIIGRHSEIAVVGDGVVKWAAFRKLQKRPKHVWIASPGADLYEYHSRFIRADGTADYAKRVVALSKSGKMVSAIIEGTKDVGAGSIDYEAIVMAASIIEDAHRPGTFLATVRDTVGVKLPIPQGEHLDVFKLRDGPKVGDRRRPLLHWVAKHVRKVQKKEYQVKEHLRGVHEFDIDGMSVKLEAS